MDSGSLASVSHSEFSENSGAGIFNGGTLVIDHSTLSDNAGVWAGGIFTAGPLTVKHSAITHNTASFGGGIYICVEGQPLPPFVLFGIFPPIVCHGT